MALVFPHWWRARVGAAVAVVAMGWAAWMSPMSPAALEHADLLVGMGRPADAVAHYDRIARLHPADGVAAEAAYRAARVSRSDLADRFDGARRTDDIGRARVECAR